MIYTTTQRVHKTSTTTTTTSSYSYSSRVHWATRLAVLLLLHCHSVHSFSAPSPTTTTTSTKSSTHNPMVQDLPLDSLAATASSFASVNGILVERRHADKPTFYFECAPISLLPNAFPKAAFEQAQTVAPLFNQLVDKVSMDAEFLQTTLAQVIQADPFTANLLELYQELYVNTDNKDNNFAPQADRLGLFRSDYMLHQGGIKQVEMNTIASSFGALSTRVAALHRHLVATTSHEAAVQDFMLANKQAILQSDTSLNPIGGVPDNPALVRLAQALDKAVQQYVKRFQPASAPVILFVVQPGETNTADQRLLEFQVTQAHGWRVLRKSLTDLSQQAHVDPSTGVLSVDDQVVAVVYYRAGYAPTDYAGPAEWQARKVLENSLATKSPCLGHHLVGTKKVQQALARPNVLERFLSNPEDVQQLRRVFAGLYSLGTDFVAEDQQVLSSILQEGNEKGFVLKPQREGGGYNFYGAQMADKLRPHVTFEEGEGKVTVDHSVLSEYILMERLVPPEQRAILLRSGQVEGSGPSISELGCFGTVLCGPDGTVLHNQYAGFLMRTKFSHVDEGGVAAGFATLSSPYLVE